MHLWSHRCSVVLTAAFFLFSNISVFAYSPATPQSYAKLTQDEKYLFVMISSNSPNRDGLGWNPLKRQETKKIRDTYTQSGLYLNDGSTAPLWTIDWYAFGIEPVSDGIHLIRHGPWDAPYANGKAVTFYAKNKPIRSYTTHELVSDSSDLPNHTSPDCLHLNDSEKAYTIVTNHGDYFLFDVITGNLIATRNLVTIRGGVSSEPSLNLWRGCRRQNGQSLTYAFIEKNGERYLVDLITGKYSATHNLFADPASLSDFSPHFMWLDCNELDYENDDKTIIVMSDIKHCLIDKTSCETISCDNLSGGVKSLFFLPWWVSSLVIALVICFVGYCWRRFQYFS